MDDQAVGGVRDVDTAAAVLVTDIVSDNGPLADLKHDACRVAQRRAALDGDAGVGTVEPDARALDVAFGDAAADDRIVGEPEVEPLGVAVVVKRTGFEVGQAGLPIVGGSVLLGNVVFVRYHRVRRAAGCSPGRIGAMRDRSSAPRREVRGAGRRDFP